MMKKVFFFVLSLSAFFIQTGIAQTSASLHTTAKSLMRQGDYANAILVLNRSLEKDPNNIALSKDLALSYFYQQDNVKALEVIKPLLDAKDADDQLFQIAGSIYKQTRNFKEGEKIYKKGLKKFPESGPLYNELGELQWAGKNADAIKNWEKGIQKDPSYSRNYYNAAKYYFFTTDKVWSVIYSEMFVNMEPSGNRTPEIKQLLADSYKKLFAGINSEKSSTDKNDFEKQYLQVMSGAAAILSGTVNTETLSMVRTRFILEWFASGKKPAFHLFKYQQQLLKDGMFEAYNQWLLGASENLPAYQNWVNTHTAEHNAFSTLMKARMFKVPSDQYYR